MMRKTIMNKTELDRYLMQTSIRCVYMHIAERGDNWGCAPHKHDYHEICFVRKGRGIYTIDDVEYSMEEGDIFLLPKGVNHGETIDRYNPYELCFIMVDHIGEYACYVESLFFGKALRVHTVNTSLSTAHKYVDILIEEIIRADEGYLTVADGVMHMIYAQVYRVLFGSEMARTIRPERVSRRDTLLSSIRGYVLHDCGCHVSVDALAAHFHYHPKYLSQLIRRETGKPLSEFLMSIRLDNAKELLSKTAHSVSHISDMTGFTNQNYFHRVFRQETGMTPLAYRKLLVHAPQDPSVRL